MLSDFWDRWISKPSVNKPRRVQPSLEWLEARDLPTAAPIATPFFVLANSQSNDTPLAGSGPSGYTPSQIVQAYGFNQISFSNGPNGTGQTIAIVDAYNDPNIQSDLAAFDSQFGLPTANLRVIGQSGGAAPTATDPTGGWELEEALDVEWAHAVAPGANIVLVEANSPALANLMTAVQTAANLSDVSAVSMSWGANEFSGETSYDSYFSKAGVAFIGAVGDSGAPPIYPAASPNVLAVGGTTLNLNSQNNWSSETGWSGSGGGISSLEAQPSYQKGIVTQTTTQRANPDVAYDANPNSGFAVYDSFTGSQVFGGPWYEVGGTSDAAPQWAGLVAIADQGRVLNGESTLSSNQLLTALYQMPNSNFHDITSGNNGFSAGPGYDLVTGLGTPIANDVVTSLVNGTSPSPPPGPTPTLPVITSNPTSQTVPAGQTVTFTAAASGNPTPTVQWEVSTNNGATWSAISGATSTTLTLAGVTTSMNGDEYEAIFTNSAGSVATTAATLTVTSPPAPPPPSPSPPPTAGLLPDGSFEQPSVGSGYAVDPGGTPWSYFHGGICLPGLAR
jgi:subtilase family serine protease